MIGTGAEADSATSLGAEIGQLLGDYAGSEAPDSPDVQTDAGAPPADAAPPSSPDASTTPDPAARPADGTTPERTGEDTPGAADAPNATDVHVDEPDPLADATALTYTVNGETRTFDGIRVLGDEAIITREALPDVMRRLGERDHLFETAQQQYRERQTLDSLASWNVPTADGKGTQTLTGQAGIIEMRASHARLEAALGTVIDTLQTNPASLIAVDGNGQIVLDPNAVKSLMRDAELAEIRADQALRAATGQILNPAPHAAAQIDPAALVAQAPAIITHAAGPAASSLTEQDKAMLAEQFPQYLRATTAQDRQANPRYTFPVIVDEKFGKLVQSFVQMRQQAAQTATTATAAATQNASRLLAASRGTPAKPPTTRTPAAPTPKLDRRAENADAAWNFMERAMAGRSRG